MIALGRPALVVKASASTNVRADCFITTNTSRACEAISGAPPEPGNRTVGAPYGPITVLLSRPNRSTCAAPRNPTSTRPRCR